MTKNRSKKTTDASGSVAAPTDKELKRLLDENSAAMDALAKRLTVQKASLDELTGAVAETWKRLKAALKARIQSEKVAAKEEQRGRKPRL